MMLRYLLVPLCLASGIQMTGCSSPLDITASVGCLSGLCTSLSERLSGIKWEPNSLSISECPDISGIYKEEQNISLSDKFEYLYRNKNGIKSRFETIREIPFVWTETISRHRVGPKIVEGLTKQRDKSVFYDHARMKILKDGNSIAAILVDEGGIEYKKSLVFFDGTNVGCYNGRLVVRIVSAYEGSEGGHGRVDAAEWQFKKVDNGDLSLKVQTRTWEYSSLRGFLGDSKTETASFSYPSVP